ncbi:UPF0585 protein CG18661 isoform X1 [Drosophila mojavensis]|uniref:Uncharacterized protein, isoform B n=1 Tax=Drosophila mojavensis TaxID=7230 RepID=A0A0Q9XES2_DROMO|nr:UPF0585 protein CG18661 isoform X1 [Drosophila mojavensis]KRG03038.1 uncharacterized protein Dmoj_GI17454, isoform B [Drosophila mojavensis]
MSLTKHFRCLFHVTTLRSAIKRTHPSADRNSQPISEALLQQVDKSTPNLRLLEIASGSGQHAGFLAPLLPNISFQTTEYERRDFSSIKAYAADCATGNICPPLFVDISQELQQWEEGTRAQLKPASYDYMLNCNMMHITPWNCSEGLFRAAGQLLKPGGKLFTYGPYAQDGLLTPQSNVDFDASLRSRNSEWGIRDIRDLKQLADLNGLRLERVTDMPSNNKFLTWLKL